MSPLELLRSTMLIKILSLFLINGVSGTITGLNYMEPIMQKPHTDYPPGQDPCHPLYWYPKQIPEYCNYKIPPKPKVRPVPVPIPVPMPFPAPQMPLPPPPPPVYPAPMPMPMPIPAPMMPIPGPMMPIPAPMMPIIPQYGPPPVPLPYGLPLAPSGPMIPVPGVPAMPRYPPFQNYGQMAGMVPGIEGLVSRDGGINVLPFSDAYSDLIEKHKNKMIRKKLKKLLNDYDRRFNRNTRK